MRTFLYFSIPVMIFFSCSTPAAPEYNEEVTNFLNEVSKGWSFFEDGNISLAAIAFRKAIEFNSKGDRAEAHIGLGWCLAMEDSLTKAISAFTVAVTRGPRTARDSVNMLAGMSLVYRDITPQDFSRVRDNALAALKIDPNFVFEYKKSINAADLRLFSPRPISTSSNIPRRRQSLIQIVPSILLIRTIMRNCSVK